MSPHATVCHRHRTLVAAGSRCPRCSLEESRRRGVKRQAHGTMRAHWRRLRRARLRLAGYRCELQLEGCTGQATTVHLDPALEGNHDAATIEDCLAACAHCHGVVDQPRSRGGVSMQGGSPDPAFRAPAMSTVPEAAGVELGNRPGAA